jgi:hypothetical protein
MSTLAAIRIAAGSLPIEILSGNRTEAYRARPYAHARHRGERAARKFLSSCRSAWIIGREESERNHHRGMTGGAISEERVVAAILSASQ